MKKGKDDPYHPLTILVPFSIPPPMSVSTVADNWLCSCFIVQSIPTAGSIWAVRKHKTVKQWSQFFFFFFF